MSTHLPDRTLAEISAPALTTRAGVRLALRPIRTDDRSRLADFFRGLTGDDLRFRFLTARSQVTADDITRLVAVDHRHAEHLLAFDQATGELAASLMIVADLDMKTAEVAVAVAKGYKNKGVGWTLLHHAVDLARSRGIAKLRSVESRENHEALEVERMSGFCGVDFDEPGYVTVEIDLAKSPTPLA